MIGFMSTSYAPTRIEVFRPAIGQEEIDAVAEVMRSGWIGRGPVTERFEAEWAKFIGVPRGNVLSVSCATEALYQVMWQLAGNGMFGRGSEVIVPGIGYIGTAAAVLEAGMAVQLCDVDPRTLNPTLAEYDSRVNKDTIAIVKQHYGGFDQAPGQLPVALIEDFACHPMGRPVGDFGIWSFDAMKVMSAGDGAMLYCRNPEVAAEIRLATRLGMSSESGQLSGSDRWWEFTAKTPGRRAMMNDIESAIGLVQLRKLYWIVAQRQAFWNQYQAALDGLTWLNRPNDPEPGSRSSYYTYWVQMMKPEWRDHLAVYLRERGIYTTFRYWPIHRAYGWSTLDCPGADWAADHTLNLPLHPGLSEADVDFVCDTIREFGETL